MRPTLTCCALLAAAVAAGCVKKRDRILVSHPDPDTIVEAVRETMAYE